MWKYNRKPTAPGEILKEAFLKPLRITQNQLSDHLGMDVKVINRICNEKSTISTIVAVKLAKSFGTSAEFWLNAQMANDLWKVWKKNIKRSEKLILSSPYPVQV